MPFPDNSKVDGLLSSDNEKSRMELMGVVVRMERYGTRSDRMNEDNEANIRD